MKKSDSKLQISDRNIRTIHALLTFVLRAIVTWIDRKKKKENENVNGNGNGNENVNVNGNENQN